MKNCSLIFFCLFFLAGASLPALAVEQSPTGAFSTRGEKVEQEKTYISPFLERDRLNIISLGDWMAHGVWWGLVERFQKDKSVSFTRNSNYASGFVRKEVFDWNERLKRQLSRKRVDIAILAFGSNDGRDMRVGTDTLAFNSLQWREIYTKRIDAFIVSLKQHGTAVYWLGLPIVKNSEKAETYRVLNGLYKQLARKNEVKFIESWYEFANKEGRFSFAGLDINGRPRILRTNNGIHFTMPGYRKLGRLVDEVLSADLSAMDAATKSSLEGSREREVAIISPDSGSLGSLSPESEISLESPSSYVDFINADQTITSSISGSKKTVDTIAELRGDASGELTPKALDSYVPPSQKTVKPAIQRTENSKASPEMKILLNGGQLTPKSGRDDDYSWPRNL